MSKFALLFLLVFVGGVAAAFFYTGASAFFLYQLVYFLNPDERWWSAQIPGLPWSFITAILMILMFAMEARKLGPEHSWGKQPLTKWLVLILLMYLFMFMHALNFAAHKQFTIVLLKLFIIMALAYKLIKSEALLKASIYTYCVGCFYLGYLATITGRNEFGRIEGIGPVDAGDANHFAAALAPSMIFLLYFFWTGNKKVKALCAVMGAFIANGLVLVNSRGAFLGLAAAAAVYVMFMMFSRFQQKNQRKTALFVVVFGLLSFLYVADEQFWQRMSTLEDVQDESKSGSHRVNFWLATFDVLHDYPFGVGIMGYQMVSPQYIDSRWTEGGEVNKAVHSSWFQALGELGWPGIILFVGMVVSAFRMTRKAARTLIRQGRYKDYFFVLSIECALLCFLIAGSFIDRFRAEILYWLLLYCAGAYKFYVLANEAETLPAEPVKPPVRRYRSRERTT